MSYYFLAVVDVHDKESYRRYQQGVAPIIMPHCLKVHAITENVDAVEGEFPGSILVLFEFESAKVFRSWWDSDEYTELKKLRHAAGTTHLAIGFESTELPAF
ncbi:MAG TPA: DUF1330 domain-containing protein [Amycolatopsis sp.]|jgi:uncharacterized protein (DUF1330 family)|nr:DUF1330 domain-containing protein [Amycolatopsis sp.]